MTQFMLANAPMTVNIPSGVKLNPIANDDGFLIGVAREYFGNMDGCFVVTDGSGRTEPLIDDVCDAQQLHRDIESTRFVKVARTLVHEKIEFVCWSAADYLDLPMVYSWTEFEKELLAQTARQPADFYVHFEPP